MWSKLESSSVNVAGCAPMKQMVPARNWKRRWRAKRTEEVCPGGLIFSRDLCCTELLLLFAARLLKHEPGASASAARCHFAQIPNGISHATSVLPLEGRTRYPRLSWLASRRWPLLSRSVILSGTQGNRAGTKTSENAKNVCAVKKTVTASRPVACGDAAISDRKTFVMTDAEADDKRLIESDNDTWGVLTTGDAVYRYNRSPLIKYRCGRFVETWWEETKLCVGEYVGTPNLIPFITSQAVLSIDL